MKFKIGSMIIEVTWDSRPIWEKNAKHFVKRVEEIADNNLLTEFGSTKLERIKVFRQLAIANGWTVGLKTAKEWVERHFADNGCGDPL